MTREDIHREKEQAYMQGYEDACKKYRQEPCDDAISRQAVLDLISKFIFEIHTEGGRDLNAHTNDVLRQILRNVGSDRVLPSVNPQEPKTDVLDNIKYELKRLHYHPKLDFIKNDEVIDIVLDIIDKYKAKSEPQESEGEHGKSDTDKRC